MFKWISLPALLLVATAATSADAGIFDRLARNLNRQDELAPEVITGEAEVAPSITSEPVESVGAPASHGMWSGGGYGYPFRSGCCEPKSACCSNIWDGFCATRHFGRRCGPAWGSHCSACGPKGFGGCGQKSFGCGQKSLGCGPKGFGGCGQKGFGGCGQKGFGGCGQKGFGGCGQKGFGGCGQKGFGGCGQKGFGGCGQKGFGFHGKGFGRHCCGPTGFALGGCGCGHGCGHGRGFGKGCGLAGWGGFGYGHRGGMQWHLGTKRGCYGCGAHGMYGGGCGCGDSGKVIYGDSGKVIYGDKGSVIYGDASEGSSLDINVPEVELDDSESISPPTPTGEAISPTSHNNSAYYQGAPSRSRYSPVSFGN